MASTSTSNFCRLLKAMKADEAKAPKDYQTLIRAGLPFLSGSEKRQLSQITGEERRHHRIVGEIYEKVC